MAFGYCPCLRLCVFVCVCACVSVCVCACLFVCPSVRPSVCPSVRLSVCLPVRMYVRLSVRLSVRMFVRLLCVRQPWACQHHNSSSVQAKTTKFRQRMRNNLVKVLIIFGGRLTLTLKVLRKGEVIVWRRGWSCWDLWILGGGGFVYFQRLPCHTYILLS